MTKITEQFVCVWFIQKDNRLKKKNQMDQCLIQSFSDIQPKKAESR